jgi:hypothetical protein
MTRPLDPHWQVFLDHVIVEDPVFRLTWMERFQAALSKDDVKGVRTLIEEGLPPLSTGLPLVRQAIGGEAWKSAMVLVDHGLVLDAEEARACLESVATAGHIPLAEKLVEWGGYPLVASLGEDWWYPANWLIAMPEFSQWWVSHHPVTLGAESPHATPHHRLEVQKVWLAFLGEYEVPGLADRVVDACAAPGTPWALGWETALASVWRRFIRDNNPEALLRLTRLGLVPDPACPAKPGIVRFGRHDGELESRSFVLLAVEHNHARLARWLSAHPGMVEDAVQEWPGRGVLSALGTLTPATLDALLTLPLDWAATDPKEGTSLMTALLDHASAMAEEEDSEEEEVATFMGVLEAFLPRIGHHCPVSLLDAKNPAAKNQSPLYFCYHDFPSSIKADLPALDLHMRALMEEGRLHASLLPATAPSRKSTARL